MIRSIADTEYGKMPTREALAIIAGVNKEPANVPMRELVLAAIVIGISAVVAFMSITA